MCAALQLASEQQDQLRVEQRQLGFAFLAKQWVDYLLGKESIIVEQPAGQSMVTMQPNKMVARHLSKDKKTP